MSHHFNPTAGPSLWNNGWIIESLDEENMEPEPRPVAKRAVKPVQCLPARLPSMAFMRREGDQLAPREVIRQLKRSPSLEEETHEEEGSPAHDDQEDNAPAGATPPASPASTRRFSLYDTVQAARKALPTFQLPSSPTAAQAPKRASGWTEPQPWQISRAIEQKDIMYLMEVRDRAFHLLLRRTGDATPLLHAMRIGTSHREVAIVLVGAMSRWVNRLEDEDMDKPRTKVLLKALRTNLKLAIDGSLQLHQSDLIASFLQTLVMSEGERWLADQISKVGLALRAGTEGKPVQTAGDSVRAFATKELGKAQAIAALEDYVANATADLLMMAAWSLALDKIQVGDTIPTWYFARDDRVYRAFVQRVEGSRGEIQRVVGKRLRWQMRVLVKALEGRQETQRRKVEVLREELDEGQGV